MGNEDFGDDDVVIEGSDLYNALSKIGCIDFEITPVYRTEFPEDTEESDNSENTVPASRYERFLDTCQRVKSACVFNENGSDKFCGVKELQVILQLKPLLDDHSLSIQSVLKESEEAQKHKQVWFQRILSSSLLTTSIFSKKLRIFKFIVVSSLTLFQIHARYCKFSTLRRLENLVATQNEIFHLQKRALRILKNGYGLKLDSKRPSRKFTDLETGRLKFLQEFCETLSASIEHCCRVFYKSSTLITDLLPPSVQADNLITKFSDESFKIRGELTYKVLQQHYYTYVLVQSEMMNLLAIVYSRNSDRCQSQIKLSRIIYYLQNILKVQRDKLSDVVHKYQACKISTVHRKLRRPDSSKFQDLYVHVDLLSRKLQSAYGTISSILEDIDGANNQDTEEFVDSLVQRMNEAYKQVDTARDFIEFNTLLIGKFRNTQAPEEKLNYINSINKNENLPVVFDADPQVMDECFEEYIREEYLRPLCEDDDVSLERAKMDKLLEKNFMSELKSVLIEKYRSMSEREAKALLRYRKANCDGEFGKILAIPPPPPLPVDDFSGKERKNRPPVPLPRTFSPEIISRTKTGESEGEIVEPAERFSLKMAIGERLPAFSACEETFVGSGENSEEELVGSECEDDIID